MKSKIALFTLAFLFPVLLFGQGKVGITYVPFAKISLLGKSDNSALSPEIYKTTCIGIQYVHPIKGALSWETGLKYTLMKVKTAPDVNSTILPSDTLSTLSLVEIPIALRAEFAEFLYFTGGALLDFDLNSSAPISKQTGLGLMAGLGVQYEFKMGLSLFANPYVKLHSLVPFRTWKNQQRIVEAGMRVGLAYRL